MTKSLILTVICLFFVLSGCKQDPGSTWSQMSQEAYDYHNKTRQVKDKQVNMTTDNENEKSQNVQSTEEESEKVVKSDTQWKQQLDPVQYRVLRKKATERAFTGKYWNHYEDGKYTCAGCGQELFDSDTKFKSGCGWPSYFKPVADDVIIEKVDRSAGMIRTEVICSKCGGHLGHVFNDGPNPTGLRYCINSASIEFSKDAVKPVPEKQSNK